MAMCTHQLATQRACVRPGTFHIEYISNSYMICAVIVLFSNVQHCCPSLHPVVPQKQGSVASQQWPGPDPSQDVAPYYSIA